MKIKDRSQPVARPRVLIIGGDDVDARIELMQRLSDEFTLAAAGTAAALQQRFSATGFSYYYYPLGRGSNPLKDIRSFNALLRLLDRFRPSIVHSFDTKPCVYGRLAARLAGIPVVVGTLPGLGTLYVDNGRRRRLVRTIYENLQRLASHLADFTIFQNHDDAKQFRAKGVVPRERSTVIPGSGVRTDLFDPGKVSQAEREEVRASLGVPQDAVLVTMISRLIRSKGVEEFVAAAQIARQRHPQAHFLLVGPADQESVDRFQPEELAQLARAVHWPGARRDIPQILATTDVFVLPSFYREGIPRVLLEAAAMGLPIVTTRSPGCVDVVADGVNGFLVPIRNPPALAVAISRLVEQAELRQRFGEESRRRAVNSFDLAIVAEQTRSLYRDLLALK